MKTIACLAVCASILGLTTTRTTGAEETATVKQDQVNVRGLASFRGEVITKLRKGEKVTVLEEITVAKAKAGEPAKWYRIQLPTNTPVWVHASFITNQTVLPKKLNIRAGPGENFSVVAVLEKGAPVKEIRKVENWLEIEAPANAFAFVAADFFDKPPTTATPVEIAAKPTLTPVVVETVEPVPAPVVAKDKPLVPAKPELPKETPKEAPKETPLAARPVVPAPAVVIEPAPEEKVFARIVRREGIVRRVFNIQGPTDFALENIASGKRVNYLFTGKSGLQLKYYVGKQIVVTGEEGVDRRWPNLPMITINTLEIVE
jgi:uncharacterized protein YgiM (DUF1202 family)